VTTLETAPAVGQRGGIRNTHAEPWSEILTTPCLSSGRRKTASSRPDSYLLQHEQQGYALITSKPILPDLFERTSSDRTQSDSDPGPAQPGQAKQYCRTVVTRSSLLPPAVKHVSTDRSPYTPATRPGSHHKLNREGLIGGATRIPPKFYRQKIPPSSTPRNETAAGAFENRARDSLNRSTGRSGDSCFGSSWFGTLPFAQV
jgi:hypothetical protein